MTILTAVIAVATVINICVFWYESEDTSKQTKILAEKVGGIVDSMNIANSNNQEAIKNAFKANRDAVNASEQQSEKTLNASVVPSRLDQRAWVTAVAVDPPDRPDGSKVYLKEGEAFPSIKIQIANTGKTPAIDLTADANAGGMPKEFDFIPIYAKRERYYKPGKLVLAPGMTYHLATAPIERLKIITVRDIELFTFRAYGKIDYFDIFGKAHHAKFCMVLNEDFSKWSACPEYNEIDQ
jgi:hypothetical protein